MSAHIVRDQIEEALRAALVAAVEAGELSAEAIEGVPLNVDPPKNPEHGDYATAVALALAKPAKMNPRKIAEAISKQLASGGDFIERVDIAGPGFLNLTLSRSFWQQEVARIVAAAGDFGSSNVGGNEKVLVEYVSANPTGPLHVGHARNAAVGDTVANLMSAAGYDVSREFYINDVGVQMDNLGKSICYRAREAAGGEPFPEDAEGLYYGTYVSELAKQFSADHPDADFDATETHVAAREFAYPLLLEEIRKTLARFNVTFDRYFSEREVQGIPERQTIELAGTTMEASIDKASAVWASLKTLEEGGKLFAEEGAIFFRTTDYDDDKDRVVIKSDGTTTYLTPDIAYHHNKLSRGFELLIDVWGADHHGYIPRMRAGIEALGGDGNRFQVVVIQMVRLFRKGEELKMSKRAGEYVTLDDLIDEVGPDASRFNLLTRTSDAPMDFDLDVAVLTNEENPVFYVQYGHARIQSIFRRAAEVSLASASSVDEVRARAREADLSRLVEDVEISLVRTLEDFPDVVAVSAERREPHRVVFFLQDLVRAFHAYYGAKDEGGSVMYPVVDVEDAELSFARLALCEAVRTVIANGLELCGVSAPDRLERDNDGE